MKRVKNTSGSLLSDTVMESLRAYRELAAQWVNMVFAHKKVTKKKDIRDISKSFGPKSSINVDEMYLYIAMVTLTIKDDNWMALKAIEENDIQLIKQLVRNKKDY